MNRLPTRRNLFPLLALSLAACGVAGERAAAPASSAPSSASSGSAAVSSAPVVQAPATPAPASAAPVVEPVGTVTFRVRENESKATFRVREQLAGRELPNDAVGTTGAVTGQITLRLDGTPVPEASKVSVDLRQLQTDNRMRDSFIKQNTLETGRYPIAEFVPTRAEGLPSPLPAAGEHSFTLIGTMSLHGVQREVTWSVTARRNAGQVEGKATTAVKFGDFGMTAPRVPAVLSIVDEIRLELDLVASQAS